ncbi:MAG: hypothetical protein ACLUI3_05250 [Christensenellales bacterium]
MAVVLNTGGMMDTLWFKDNPPSARRCWPGRAAWRADWRRRICWSATSARPAI